MLDPNNTRVGSNPHADGEYTSEDQIVRPTQNTGKTTKDFKKILGKNPREQKDEEEEFGEANVKKPPAKVFSEGVGAPVAEVGKNKDDEENASQGFSLFDPAAHRPQAKKEVVKGPSQAHARVESPADMFKNMSTREAKSSELVSEKPVEDKFTTRYTQEQPDLTYVNPLATTARPIDAIETAKPLPKEISRVDIAALVDQIVKNMYTVETQGRTDTVITLQNPPLFKDAHIVVSSFDSARGQFNISFENLTQAAQKILSDDVNRTGLINALHEKGYGVQILTFTTQTETTPLAIDESAFKGNRDQSDQEGQQQQKKKRDEAG